MGAGAPPPLEQAAARCSARLLFKFSLHACCSNLLYTPAIQIFEAWSAWAQVFPPDQTLEQAVKLATRIAEMPQPAAIMGKEVVRGGATRLALEGLNG